MPISGAPNDLCWPIWKQGSKDMGKVSGLIHILSDHEMELIRRSVLRVLAEVGMRIEHGEALAALEIAGRVRKYYRIMAF